MKFVALITVCSFLLSCERDIDELHQLDSEMSLRFSFPHRLHRITSTEGFYGDDLSYAFPDMAGMHAISSQADQDEFLRTIEDATTIYLFGFTQDPTYTAESYLGKFVFWAERWEGLGVLDEESMQEFYEQMTRDSNNFSPSGVLGQKAFGDLTFFEIPIREKYNDRQGVYYVTSHGPFMIFIYYLYQSEEQRKVLEPIVETIEFGRQ